MPEVKIESNGRTETYVMSALDKPAAELTVMDVYDIAAVLGQEFERVIDRFGCECLVGVVPRVVRVLELLEALVGRGSVAQEADELRRELERLNQERSDRYEQEKKHQMVSPSCPHLEDCPDCLSAFYLNIPLFAYRLVCQPG